MFSGKLRNYHRIIIKMPPYFMLCVIQGKTTLISPVQSKFNGLNTFGTMKICSRHGQLELMSANHSPKSGDITVIFFDFL